MATPIPQNRAPFTVAEILAATAGTLVEGPRELAVVGVCTDTRAVTAGNLFVALRGEALDGHAFVDRAVSSGAVALLVGRGVARAATPVGIAIVEVDDTLVALGVLARAHRDRWAREHHGPVAVIAITGSAGKTTTKELTAAAASACFGDAAVHATRGNLNNRIGVPLTLLALEPSHQIAVIEAGMSLRAEIAQLAAIIAPDVSVLTHVGMAHAEGIKDPGERAEEAVLREKSPLLRAAKVCAITSADEPLAVSALRDIAVPRIFTFGRHDRATHRLTALVAEEGGSKVTITRGRGAITVSLPLLGNAAALDLCAALAAADAAAELAGVGSVDDEALAHALARRVRPVAGRLAPRLRADGALIVDDTYNASPSAYRESLETVSDLAKRSGRRLVVVAGEMRELGAVSIEAHQEVGTLITRAAPALLITVGPEAERMGLGLAGRVTVLHAHDSNEAAALIAPRIESNDLVLVKGSRGVATERVVDAILARGGEIEDARLAAAAPHARGR